MKSAAGVMGFVYGVALAAMALGVLLGVAWLGLWGLASVGGPDWRMPMQLLQSAATLILLGWIIRLLTRTSLAKVTS
jgi:hypothetical protein